MQKHTSPAFVLPVRRSDAIATHASNVVLLTIGITTELTILATFNSWLGWDIFSPRLESWLRAVFGCVAVLLVASGLIAFTFSLRQIAQSISNHHGIPEIQMTPRYRRWSRVKGSISRSPLPWFLLTTILTVVLCHSIDHLMTVQRYTDFRTTSRDAMLGIDQTFAEEISRMQSPPRSNTSKRIYDLVQSLDELPGVTKTTLYMLDANDAAVVCGYTAWRDYNTEDGFARFYPLRPFERTLKRALEGDGASLEMLNGSPAFEYYHLVRSNDGLRTAVVRLDGDPSYRSNRRS